MMSNKTNRLGRAKLNISPFKFRVVPLTLVFCFALLLTFTCNVAGQTKKTKNKTSAKNAPKNQTKLKLPKITQIDAAALKSLLKTNGKPLLINFWATWCDPCREEFPDLVKINADFKGKIDFITISLDELSEINKDVPKFLVEMKAEMPGYLLKVQDEGAAIALVTKDWQGGLPFTILFNEKGEIAYFTEAKIKTEILRQTIEKTISTPQIQN